MAVSGPDMVVLRTPVQLRGKDFTTIGDFTVSAGQTIPFVLAYSASHLSPPVPIDAQKALVDTEKFWRRWQPLHQRRQMVGRCPPVAHHIEGANLSTDGRHGCRSYDIPARATWGSRNWDYRFCWLRDATFTLLALMNAGYYEEAQSWHAWLLRAVAGQPSQVQIMYGLLGERRLTEWEVTWLPGYEGLKPVQLAMPPPPNCNSTFLERSWMHSIKGAMGNWP